MYTYPIIDLHATWLVINGIQGCPNKCKYCFLNGVNLTHKKPEKIIEPNNAVNLLVQSKYYNSRIPICIGTQTDIFSTPSNIKYALELLKELTNRNIKNTIIFITKCLIPDYFITEIKKYKQQGFNFIFFLSYSGLDKNIEIGINKEKLKQNFINLHNANLKIIHYWRPFIPENSTKEKIIEVYDFVKKYAECSVAIGLKVHKNMINHIDFWEDLSIEERKACLAESVWTKKGFDYIWGKNKLIDSNYPIYQSTSCALAKVLNSADINAFYQTSICTKFNQCPDEQRKICLKHYKKSNITNEYITSELKKIGIYNNNIKITISNENNLIKIEGIDLSTKDFTYLTQITQCKIIASKDPNDYYWNTSINDAKQLYI